MKQQNNYYILEKPQRSFKSFFLSIIKIPFSLPKWILSFILARNFTNAALNPNNVKTQKPVHLVFTSDEKAEKGSVIVNVLPHESLKGLKDYLLKINSSIIPLPFITKILKRQMSYNDPEDLAYIDHVLAEIDLLLEGSSTSEKCNGKTFTMDEVHIKGLETLDKPLQDYFHAQLYKKYGKELVEQPRTLKLDFFSLETQDSAVLDSVAVSTEDEDNKLMSERKFIVACMARDQNYINWIKDFNYSAQQIGCTVIGFNYRGIDYSKGMVWTQDNLTDDALAQVQRLLDLGAKPENIGLEGMSLGGAIATISAAKLHDRGLRVKLYNERSFRSVPRLVSGYVLPPDNCNRWNPVNWIRYLVAGLTYVVLLPIMWIVGWHMDAGSAWKRIPQVDKEYAIARDQAHDQPHNDEIIHDSWASIGSLVDEHKAQIEDKQQSGKKVSAEELNVVADEAKSHQFKLLEDQTENRVKAAHYAPRRYLVNSHNESLKLHDHMISSFSEKLGCIHSTKASNQEHFLQKSTIPLSDSSRYSLFASSKKLEVHTAYKREQAITFSVYNSLESN